MTMSNEQIEMEINNLKSQMSQKADVSTVNTLTSRVTATENANATQNTSITSLGSRVTNVEGVNASQGNSIAQLNTRVTILENK